MNYGIKGNNHDVLSVNATDFLSAFGKVDTVDMFFIKLFYAFATRQALCPVHSSICPVRYCYHDVS